MGTGPDPSARGARIEAPNGVGSGEGVSPPQPSRGSGGASVKAPATNAFSAYCRPQNVSRTKKKIHFQFSSAA